jgi:hypothetical protein
MRLLILGGVGVIVLLMALSQVIFDRYITNLGDENLGKETAQGAVVVPLPLSFDSDPFTQAIAIAESAVADGKTAQTSAEWFSLARQWQQASELMSVVPPADDRYASAQERTLLYRTNGEYARRQAETRP